MSKRRRPRCSFCKCDIADVRWLIAADASDDSTAYICDVCILLAMHALIDKLGGQR